jgi:SAM-dependent methyltransferase
VVWLEYGVPNSPTKAVKLRIQQYLERPGPISTAGFRLWRLYYLLGEWLLPSRRRARRLDREFDQMFGVDTCGWVKLSGLAISSANAGFGTHYEGVRSSLFRQAIRNVPVDYESSVFIDFGSGKGRALLLAAELPFKKVIGVEFSPQLHRIAQENIGQYLRRQQAESRTGPDIESVCLDVVDYPIPPQPAVFYFFNPFKEEVMRQVLSNIRESLEQHPREAFILYCNPVLTGLFDQSACDLVKATDEYAVFKLRGPGGYG